MRNADAADGRRMLDRAPAPPIAEAVAVRAGVVVRYEGPRGGPGMPEMRSRSAVFVGRGLGREVALVTDNRRYSGASHGIMVSATSRPRPRPATPAVLVSVLASVGVCMDENGNSASSR